MSARIDILVCVASMSLLILVLLAWYQLNTRVCDRPPSQLVDWLARDLWLATTHNAKVPLSRVCRNELANLILLLAELRQDASTTSVETLERTLYSSLGVKTTLADLKLLVRALDVMRNSPQTRQRIIDAIDGRASSVFQSDVEETPPSDKSVFTRSVIYPVPEHLHSQPNALSLADRFTISVQTFYNGTRLPRLIDTLKQLSSMQEIDRVVLWWNDAEHGTPPPSSELFERAALSFPVVVELPARNSLNNRYQVSKHIRTRAVLAMDDDLRPTPLQLRFAFEQWKVQPQRLVGFTSRHFAVNGIDPSSLDWIKAESPGGVASARKPSPAGHVADTSGANALHYRFGGCPGSMLLHPFFTHRDHMARFWSERMAPIRNIIDEHMNGEEISFNMVTTSATGLPPLVVASAIARVDAVGGAAVSGGAGHYERRVWVTRLVAAELARLHGAAVPPLINSLAVTLLCDSHATDLDNAALEAAVLASQEHDVIVRGGAGWLALVDDEPRKHQYVHTGTKFNV